MKVYFVRHGQSVGNAARIHQNGKTKLSSYGFKQAKTVANRFRKIPVDVIFSSDYTRAMQTAEAISQVVGRNVNHISLLREIKRPTALEGKPNFGPQVEGLKQLLDKNAHDPHWHHSDEENIHDLINRAQKCIDFIAARHEENIVVVSHGYFLRILFGVMMYGTNKPLEYYDRFVKFFMHQNTGITMCLYKQGIWRVITWNDHAHLG